ncbi:alkyl hydroperoxide reductase [Pacificimonas flava]|uniref:Alkyl hydroperoxide reductase n=2 Tax=Pacificimonas TaxID=1960290 RepID=A0A219B526_9SPHN|nr:MULTISPECIES: DsbE family thiol:disulfide interchange protein [Pacificimonas]MBZ6379553.1 DsbE family thiol:disulfide interchange protein [Pacificimonas aurantium]OWV33263.1 alkyl hydroperoxide reductase [Pacificimonas flava]
MIRRLAVILPLAAFLLFVVIAIRGLDSDPSRPIESGMVGQPVPDFELEGLNDANPGLAASDLRQGTVTLVNLFGSWCLPCRVEAPQLERLAASGAVVHAVAIRDETQDVEEFLAEYGDPFSRIGMDPRGRMQIEFGATGVPETYLIDGDGVIRAQWIGEIRPENVEEILARMEALQ